MDAICNVNLRGFDGSINIDENGSFKIEFELNELGGLRAGVSNNREKFDDSLSFTRFWFSVLRLMIWII
jgi:hypothetical protein